MILGTANFLREYRGHKLDSKTCESILRYFEDNGGELIDCASDYYNMYFIRNYLLTSELKFIMKVNPLDDLKDDYNSNLYCFMMRTYDRKLHNKIKELERDKIGQAVYYPHEVRQDTNIISIPNSNMFLPYVELMKLHAKVYARSIYLMPDSKVYKKCDDVIIGVDNLEQLKRNMELYEKV